jgi:hypothetical protein
MRVVDAARAVGADGVECVDEKGAVLDVLTFDAQDVPDMSYTSASDVSARAKAAREVVGDVERIVALCLDAADRAVQRNGEHTRIALDALARVCEAIAERAERLERALAALAAARDTEGDASSTDRLAAMAMAMLAGAPPATLDGRSPLTGVVNGAKTKE